MINRLFKYRFLKLRRKKRYLPTKPPYTYCKNCGNELHGQYCSVCGQYAITDNHMLQTSVSSYLENTYAFDHKIWRTLFCLITKPGFISREYMNGRIARYTHPFKFYFFSSILFFGIALSLPNEYNLNGDHKLADADSTDIVVSFSDDDAIARKREIAKAALKDSLKKIKAEKKKTDKEKALQINYEDDLAEDEEDSAFEKKVNKNMRSMTQKEFLAKLKEYMSYSMLFLMPFFGLLLWIYFHKYEKKYSANLIFSVHAHILLFLLLSINEILKYLFSVDITGWLLLAWIIHFFYSVSNFYGIRKRKCIGKVCGIMFFYLVVAIMSAFVAIIIVVAS